MISPGRLALQANATSAGSIGGDIIVQAGGASSNGQIDFTADSIQAIGASAGVSAAGGHISVQSFNDGILGVAPGELNAAGGGTVGTVTLTACVGDPARTYAGTVTGTETDTGPGTCGGSRSFPALAHFVTGLSVIDFFSNRQALWDACALLTPSLDKAFSPASFQVGGFTALTFAFSITKTPSVVTVTPGQALSFTIVITNNGPSAADGAIITLRIDGTASLVSALLKGPANRVRIDCPHQARGFLALTQKHQRRPELHGERVPERTAAAVRDLDIAQVKRRSPWPGAGSRAMRETPEPLSTRC